MDANIILNPGTGPNQIRQPLTIRDKDWWANKRAFAVATTLPTDLYYEPQWPNGSLYLWAVPTIAYPLELVTWNVIDQVQLTTSMCLPPGYSDAVIYSLAEALGPSFDVQLSPNLMELRRKAVQRIWGDNTASPLLGTNDIGIPRGGHERPYFNWRSGMSR